MKSVMDEFSFFQSLVKMLALQFGPFCEVVLHDFKEIKDGNYEKTILLIENGHITGRKVGDCGTNLGLEVLRGTKRNGNHYGYYVRTEDHKIFRSSSLYIRNNEEEVIGALCINWDITNLSLTEDYLRKSSLDNSDVSLKGIQQDEVDEIFAANVTQLLEVLISRAQKFVGKKPEDMNRVDKIAFLDFLDTKGAFLISKSGNKVCDFLGISKYTLYAYLDEARSEEKNHAKIQ